MGFVTDDGLPLDDEDEVEENNAEWEGRFRVASVACCTTVVLSLFSGIVSGLFLDTGGRQPSSGLPGMMFHQLRTYAFLTRASLVLGPFTMFAAILVLLAVLLAVLGRSDTEGESALVFAESVGWAVMAGALLLWGVLVWWAGLNPVHMSRGIRFGSLAGPLATAIIAAAATWWARNERRSE